MALRFRKSIKIAPGVKLNIGKKGIGISAGVKGARVSINSSGRITKTVSIPGTGISSVDSKNINASKNKTNNFSKTTKYIDAVSTSSKHNKFTIKRGIGIFLFLTGILGLFSNKIDISSLLTAITCFIIGYFLFTSKTKKKDTHKYAYEQEHNIKCKNETIENYNTIQVISDYKK